jgi:hypothetical protein
MQMAGGNAHLTTAQPISPQMMLRWTMQRGGHSGQSAMRSGHGCSTRSIAMCLVVRVAQRRLWWQLEVMIASTSWHVWLLPWTQIWSWQLLRWTGITRSCRLPRWRLHVWKHSWRDSDSLKKLCHIIPHPPLRARDSVTAPLKLLLILARILGYSPLQFTFPLDRSCVNVLLVIINVGCKHDWVGSLFDCELYGGVMATMQSEFVKLIKGWFGFYRLSLLNLLCKFEMDQICFRSHMTYQ